MTKLILLFKIHVQQTFNFFVVVMVSIIFKTQHLKKIDCGRWLLATRRLQRDRPYHHLLLCLILMKPTHRAHLVYFYWKTLFIKCHAMFNARRHHLERNVELKYLFMKLLEKWTMSLLLPCREVLLQEVHSE